MTTQSPCLRVSPSPCLFLLGGIAAGAAVGWIAARCHASGIAPVGLVSLAAGLALGYALSKLAAATGMKVSKRLLVGVAAFALVAVFVEHTWLYWDFRRQWEEARAVNPQVALFREAEPWTPAEYLWREVSTARIGLWCVDAALIIAGAVGVVFARRGASAEKVVVAEVASGNDTNGTLNSEP